MTFWSWLCSPLSLSGHTCTSPPYPLELYVGEAGSASGRGGWGLGRWKWGEESDRGWERVGVVYMHTRTQTLTQTVTDKPIHMDTHTYKQTPSPTLG